MRIGRRRLGEQVLVVAEIGNNHEGSIAVARDLVNLAADCGADAVKFQTFQTEHYISRQDAARFALLKRFELPHAAFRELADVARSRDLLFICTPLDLHSLEFLTPFVDAFKIASGDNDFYPLISGAVESGRPLIISTGVSDEEKVEQAVAFVRRTAAKRGEPEKLVLLHCVTSYPAPPEAVNLRAMTWLADQFGYPVGYSDHTVGIDAAVLSVALGAQIVEKHFTLDHAFSTFRDHQLSADPEEMSELVRRIRFAERLLGRPEKKVQPAEEPARTVVRRSIAAAADREAGHILSMKDLDWLRPGGGLPPGAEDELVGRRLVRNVRSGEFLAAADVV